MERIKALARILASACLTMLVLSYTSVLFQPLNDSKQAYASLLDDMTQVEEKMSLDQGALTQVVKEEEFLQGTMPEGLGEQLKEVLYSAKSAVLYEEATLDEVTVELLNIYQSQQALLQDPVYELWMGRLRIASGTMGIVSAGIVFVIFLIQKNKKRKANKKSS